MMPEQQDAVVEVLTRMRANMTACVIRMKELTEQSGELSLQMRDILEQICDLESYVRDDGEPK